MKSNRVLEFLSKWTEEKFAYSCAELASELCLDETDVKLVLASLENVGETISVIVDGVIYYASSVACVERALIDLVQHGEAIIEEDSNGELLYRTSSLMWR